MLHITEAPSDRPERKLIYDAPQIFRAKDFRRAAFYFCFTAVSKVLRDEKWSFAMEDAFTAYNVSVYSAQIYYSNVQRITEL